MEHLARITTLGDEVRAYIPGPDAAKPPSINALFRLHDMHDEIEKAVLLLREELERHAEGKRTLGVVLASCIDGKESADRPARKGIWHMREDAK